LPYQRRAEELLYNWREAERRLATALTGSPEWAGIAADIANMRAAYQSLIEEALAAEGPELPPFPMEI
jgi:hypothetical protein